MILILLLSLISHANEQRIKIGVIDSGINIDNKIKPYLCEDHFYDLTKTSTEDTINHGTTVVSLLIKNLNPNKHCILMIKWIHDDNDKHRGELFLKSFQVASKLKLKYLNVSAGGPEAGEAENSILNTILNAGTIVTLSAGNENHDFNYTCDYYPACYKINARNLYIVGNFDNYANPQDNSNYNTPVNAWANGHNKCYNLMCHNGTSFSAPIKLNKLILEGAYEKEQAFRKSLQKP